jgi:hypothetical protein
VATLQHIAANRAWQTIDIDKTILRTPNSLRRHYHLAQAIRNATTLALLQIWLPPSLFRRYTTRGPAATARRRLLMQTKAEVMHRTLVTSHLARRRTVTLLQATNHPRLAVATFHRASIIKGILAPLRTRHLTSVGTMRIKGMLLLIPMILTDKKGTTTPGLHRPVTPRMVLMGAWPTVLQVKASPRRHPDNERALLVDIAASARSGAVVIKAHQEVNARTAHAWARSAYSSLFLLQAQPPLFLSQLYRAGCRQALLSMVLMGSL